MANAIEDRTGLKFDFVETFPAEGRGGGSIRTDRRLTAPERTPLCNLYLAKMKRIGVELDSFGTSNGALDLNV